MTRLAVDVHPDLLNTVRFHKPTQGFRGKFSLDYVLAAMLLDGRGTDRHPHHLIT